MCLFLCLLVLALAFHLFGISASGETSVSVGGTANHAHGYQSFVGGGWNNSADRGSAIVGGWKNQAVGFSGIVAGGENTVSDIYSFIGSGRGCSVHSQFSVLGGGWMNTVGVAHYAFVGGGKDNLVVSNSSHYTTLVGGEGNTVSGNHSMVGGGFSNRANASSAGVGGGNSNTAGGFASVVVGGQANGATGDLAVVGGGEANKASGFSSTVGGGRVNTAKARYSIVAGGHICTAVNQYAIVGGGYENTAGGGYSLVAGGCVCCKRCSHLCLCARACKSVWVLVSAVDRNIDGCAFHTRDNPTLSTFECEHLADAMFPPFFSLLFLPFLHPDTSTRPQDRTRRFLEVVAISPCSGTLWLVVDTATPPRIRSRW